MSEHTKRYHLKPRQEERRKERRSIMKIINNLELWRYHILLFCDPLSMIKLSWVNRVLRRQLNEPRFIVEWQTHCYYMARECKCERNLFYLQLESYCEFAWEWNFDLERVSEVNHVLEMYRREVWRHQVYPAMQTLPLPAFPGEAKDDWFACNAIQSWIENLIVPMPRMVYVPVECTRIQRIDWNDRMIHQGNATSTPLTEEQYRDRKFWRYVHKVDTNGPVPPAGFEPWDAYVLTDRDPLELFVEHCNQANRDPLDPADDPDGEGYRTCQMLRQAMYTTGLGEQAYPFDLCLRPDELFGNAKHLGVEFMDRLFLPSHLGTTQDHMMIDHRGPVYFDGVRYNNESGDLVPWALSTLSVCYTVYNTVWRDAAHQFVFGLDTHLRTIAMQFEAVFPLTRMHRQIEQIEHLMICSGCQNHPSTDPNQAARTEAMRQFWREGEYRQFNDLIKTRVNHMTSMRMDNHHYVTEILPMLPMGYRNEKPLVRDIYELMEWADYISHLSLVMGPTMSPESQCTMMHTLRTYLAMGASLLAFAPTFKRAQHHRPSRSNEILPPIPPRIEISNNHRFQWYLKFLNARTCYYQPESMQWSRAREEQSGRRTDWGRY